MRQLPDTAGEVYPLDQPQNPRKTHCSFSTPGAKPDLKQHPGRKEKCYISKGRKSQPRRKRPDSVNAKGHPWLGCDEVTSLTWNCPQLVQFLLLTLIFSSGNSSRYITNNVQSNNQVGIISGNQECVTLGELPIKVKKKIDLLSFWKKHGHECFLLKLSIYGM